MPGPGTYDLSVTDSKNGFVFHSRYKSYGGAVISKTGERFDRTKLRSSLEIPGPGNYEQVLETNKKGSYAYSKWKNSGAPVFPKAHRQVNLDTSVTRKSKCCCNNN